MTSLLVIVVLVLLGIAIWQLTKIFHLTQVGAATYNENPEVASDKDNKVNGYLMFGFLGFIYYLQYILYLSGVTFCLEHLLQHTVRNTTA